MSTRPCVVGVASPASLHPSGRAPEASRHRHGVGPGSSPASAAAAASRSSSRRQPRPTFPSSFFGLFPGRGRAVVTSACRSGPTLQLPRPNPEAAALSHPAALLVPGWQGRAHGHADVEEAENGFVTQQILILKHLFFCKKRHFFWKPNFPASRLPFRGKQNTFLIRFSPCPSVGLWWV